MGDDDDLVAIEPGGRVRPVGASAAVRFQAREGMYHVLPSPHHLVVLREVVVPGASGDARTCRLSGELTAPGAISDVLALCGTASWTGELMVFDNAGTRSLFIAEGMVVGAITSVSSERLGQVLYRYGVLGMEQVEHCLAHAPAVSRFGESAVKLGFVRREKLFEMLARQIEEIVRAALLVSDGYFYFLDGFDATALPAQHALPLSTLLRDGIRWMHELRSFRTRIPSMEQVPVAIAALPAHAAEHATLYAAIDGQRSAAELGRHLGIGELALLRALFELVHRGVVAIHPPRLDPEQAIGACNGAVALILRELDGMDLGDEVREQLAEFARQPPQADLFDGAGPLDDGTFTPHIVIANFARANIRSPEDLSSSLRKYVDYALFLARPHVQRASARARSNEASPQRLTHRVAAMLDPIGPGGSK